MGTTAVGGGRDGGYSESMAGMLPYQRASSEVPQPPGTSCCHPTAVWMAGHSPCPPCCSYPDCRGRGGPRPALVPLQPATKARVKTSSHHHPKMIIWKFTQHFDASVSVWSSISLFLVKFCHTLLQQPWQTWITQPPWLGSERTPCHPSAHPRKRKSNENWKLPLFSFKSKIQRYH